MISRAPGDVVKMIYATIRIVVADKCSALLASGITAFVMVAQCSVSVARPEKLGCLWRQRRAELVRACDQFVSPAPCLAKKLAFFALL